MIDNKFKDFKKSVSKQEFDSVDFLTAKAKQLEAQDPELSKRILLRVSRLNSAIKEEKQADSMKSTEVTKQNKVNSNIEEVESKSKPYSHWQRLIKSPFILFVVLPTILFAGYQSFWASERYESQAKVTVQQPDGTATMDASMALLTGLGVSNASTSDTELIKTYIYSNDMLEYLEQTVDIRSHYSDTSIDVFSRLGREESQESLLEYFFKYLRVEVNEKSGVVSIYMQAFSPEFSEKLTRKIVERAEWFINSIGHQLAEAQLEFIRGEHQLVEDKLKQAQGALLAFQQRYNLLDPTAEGVAMQQITYQLEGQLSTKEAELKGLQAVMSASAPRVMTVQNEIDALRKQLMNERGRLAQSGDDMLPVSEIMATFADYKIQVELALQAYTSSQVSLEKSRIEAYRQLKYLVVVETATLPEENKYPEVFYNVSLFAILALMLFIIGRIIQSTIKELK